MATNVFPAMSVYGALFDVFKADGEILALEVNEINIRPMDDASETAAGPFIAYAIEQQSWDRKAQRGRCNIRLTCGSQKNKLEARQVFDAVDELMEPKGMTTPFSGVKFGKLKQAQAGVQDLGQTPQGYWQVGATYDVMLIEEP